MGNKHIFSMRFLTKLETKLVLVRLFNYIGENIKKIIENKEKSLLLNKKRVYYLKKTSINRTTCIPRNNLISMGQYLGKFSHNGEFQLVISALDILKKYVKHKVWLKLSSESTFLSGKNLRKSDLKMITKKIPAYSGVIVYGSVDIALGLGVLKKPTTEIRKLETSTIIIQNMVDVGEFLRAEREL